MKGMSVVTIALLLTAAAAQAQYPGGRGMGMGRGRGGDGGREQHGTAPATPSRTEVERQDPVVVLMSNRSALALTDSEMTRLEGLDATVMERNRPLLAQYDSLAALVPKDADAGDAVADGATRAQLFGVLREVRKNYQDAEHDALALLREDQRGKATKLLESARPKERDFTRREGSGRERR